MSCECGCFVAHYAGVRLAFSPDGSTLWVADSTIGAYSWTAYPVTQDPAAPLGKATQVLNPATLGEHLGVTDQTLAGNEGLSDGFKIDERGYIWSSMPNGFCVIDPTQARVVCQILLGVNGSNVAFGKGGDVWLTGAGMVWRMQRKITDSKNV